MRFLRYAGPMLVWMGMIFAFSTRVGAAEHSESWIRSFFGFFAPDWAHQLSQSTIDAINHYIRKTGHFSAYCLLGFLALRAVRFGRPHTSGQMLLVSWLIATAYAASDEYHQSFVGGRTASITDVLLDSVGAGFGLGLIWLKRLASKPPDKPNSQAG